MKSLKSCAMVFLVVASCTDDYPPCRSERPQSPDFTSGSVGASASSAAGDFYRPQAYSLNEQGEVCECGPYEMGCVESPEKARAAGAKGAYCTYPRQGDGTIVIPTDSAYAPGLGRGACVCLYSGLPNCDTAVGPFTVEISGWSAAECTGRLREILSHYNSVNGSNYDLGSIVCSPK